MKIDKRNIIPLLFEVFVLFLYTLAMAVALISYTDIEVLGAILISVNLYGYLFFSRVTNGFEHKRIYEWLYTINMKLDRKEIENARYMLEKVTRGEKC